jgi:hypothetical protein
LTETSALVSRRETRTLIATVGGMTHPEIGARAMSTINPAAAIPANDQPRLPQRRNTATISQTCDPEKGRQCRDQVRCI